MHSPFPGMDPYLERPDRWSGVHARSSAVLGEMLTWRVAPRFFVDSEDSVYVLGLDDPARPLGRPDLYVAEPGLFDTLVGSSSAAIRAPAAATPTAWGKDQPLCSGRMRGHDAPPTPRPAHRPIVAVSGPGLEAQIAGR